MALIGGCRKKRFYGTKVPFMSLRALDTNLNNRPLRNLTGDSAGAILPPPKVLIVPFILGFASAVLVPYCH